MLIANPKANFTCKQNRKNKKSKLAKKKEKGNEQKQIENRWSLKENIKYWIVRFIHKHKLILANLLMNIVILTIEKRKSLLSDIC